MSSENERNEFRQNQTVPKIVLYAQSGMNDFVFNIPFSVFQTTYRDNPLFDLKICSDTRRPRFDGRSRHHRHRRLAQH